MIVRELSADDVRVELGKATVLSGVSARVRRGEVLAVAGPNGAGKSTLFKCMAGLLRPAAGRVAIEDADVMGLDRRALGRQVAYLPQDRIVHWPVSVRTLVGLGRLPHRAGATSANEQDHLAIAAAMTVMDVDRLAERSTMELSGGERARVLVARALAQQAHFILMDEPTSGLDPAHTLALFAHFRRLAAMGHGIAVALHDLSLAARYADTLILLKDGRIAAAGPVSDVLREDVLGRVYGVKATVAEVSGVPVVLAHTLLT
jgi:iron complex transport system ATP-binding protein